MNAMNETERGLLGLLPPIRRARGYRLYAEDGRRFLDFWQDDGRGLLGAKGTGLGTVAKAETDKGLASPLPSIHSRRLTKALAAAWPGYAAARFYADPSRARRALLAWARATGHGDRAAAAAGAEAQGVAVGSDPEASLLWDPARRGRQSETALARLERPFASFLPEEAAQPLGLAWLRLPCPRAFSPVVLLARTEEAAASLPAEDLPPLQLAVAAKALAEFAAFSRGQSEEAWRKSDRRLAPLFERTGPYLYPRCAQDAYPAFFAAALAKGVLLSPFWELPSLLPAEFDDGELKALAETALSR
jgi:hypothetical protein